MMRASSLVRRLLGRLLGVQGGFDIPMDVHEHFDRQAKPGNDLRMGLLIPVGDEARQGDGEHRAEVPQLRYDLAQYRRDLSGVANLHLEAPEVNRRYAALIRHAVPLSELNQHLAGQIGVESSLRRSAAA